MELRFLSPGYALVALLVIIPLAVVYLKRRAAAALRRKLSFSTPRLASRLLFPVAILGAFGAFGLAAADPVLLRTEEHLARTDVEICLVLDTSRSMLARATLHGPTRLERAKRLALKLHAAFDGVPVCIASFTDRVLPHLFPSVNEHSIVSVLERSIAIDQPPSSRKCPEGSVCRTTDLGAIEQAASPAYFSEDAEKRIVVLFTDGEHDEMRSLGEDSVAERFADEGVELYIVHVFNADDRVFNETGKPRRDFRADPSSREVLSRLDDALGGNRLFHESEMGAFIGSLEPVIGEGPAEVIGRIQDVVHLAPYAVALGALFLLPAFFRRNF